MFNNFFPITMLGLMRQTFPRRRFQPALHPYISLHDYTRRSRAVEPGRFVLSERELQQAQTYTIRKRQDEWLTGRVCAKLACMKFGTAHDHLSERTLMPTDIQIVNTLSGRPQLTGRLPDYLRAADLSLTHGAGCAAALVADCPCGVDIQNPRNTLKRVREKYCTIEEEDFLRQHIPELSDLQQLTLLWTAKEAVKKGLSEIRMPGFLELILSETEAHTTGWVFTFLVSSREYEGYPATVRVAAELYESYGLALTLIERGPHA